MAQGKCKSLWNFDLLITYLLIDSSMVMYILISLVRNGLWKAFRASGIHLVKRALRYGKMRIRGKYEGKMRGLAK